MLTLSQQIRAMLATGTPRVDIVSHCRRLWPDANPTYIARRITGIAWEEKKKVKAKV